MENKNTLTELTDIVHEYRQKRQSFDPKELVDLRERLSLCLFYLSDYYSFVRSESEKASFLRKIYAAKETENLRKIQSPKKLTRDELNDKVVITSESYYMAEVEANAKYYKCRMLIESANQILNSIASRLHSINK